MASKHLINYSVCISRNGVTITIFTDENFKRRSGYQFGFLEVTDGRIGKETYSADNLLYFTDLDNPEKVKEIKKDLKKIDQHYKGVIKDIRWCMKQVIKKGLYKKGD